MVKFRSDKDWKKEKKQKKLDHVEHDEYNSKDEDLDRWLKRAIEPLRWR
jgi:hypothetical protein